MALGSLAGGDPAVATVRRAGGRRYQNGDAPLQSLRRRSDRLHDEPVLRPRSPRVARCRRGGSLAAPRVRPGDGRDEHPRAGDGAGTAAGDRAAMAAVESPGRRHRDPVRLPRPRGYVRRQRPGRQVRRPAVRLPVVDCHVGHGRPGPLAASSRPRARRPARCGPHAGTRGRADTGVRRLRAPAIGSGSGSVSSGETLRMGQIDPRDLCRIRHEFGNLLLEPVATHSRGGSRDADRPPYVSR
jgi:hypothetical protein